MTSHTRSRPLPASALALLAMIAASRQGLSRADLVERTGSSRVTIAQRLTELLETGLVVEDEENRPARGRPTRNLQLNSHGGLIAVADIGETRTKFGIYDLKPELIANAELERDLNASPTATLEWIDGQFGQMLEQLGRSRSNLIGACLSLRAPVSFASGTLLGPSVMTGWDNFDIGRTLGDLLGAPTIVENDVNLLALAETVQGEDDNRQLAFVKVGTGIGCGIMADGDIFRGVNGAAGDIGHIQLTGEIKSLCRCGKLGCVEAQAAGWAIARDLREMGIAAAGAQDVVDLVHQNVPEAIQLVRRAGRIVGEVVADLVSILNPKEIVIGGILADTNDHLFSGVRELVNQRCLPLATQELLISKSKGTPNAGLLGAALLVRKTLFSETQITTAARRMMDSMKTTPPPPAEQGAVGAD